MALEVLRVSFRALSLFDRHRRLAGQHLGLVAQRDAAEMALDEADNGEPGLQRDAEARNTDRKQHEHVAERGQFLGLDPGRTTAGNAMPAETASKQRRVIFIIFPFGERGRRAIVNTQCRSCRRPLQFPEPLTEHPNIRSLDGADYEPSVPSRWRFEAKLRRRGCSGFSWKVVGGRRGGKEQIDGMARSPINNGCCHNIRVLPNRIRRGSDGSRLRILRTGRYARRRFVEPAVVIDALASPVRCLATCQYKQAIRSRRMACSGNKRPHPPTRPPARCRRGKP